MSRKKLSLLLLVLASAAVSLSLLASISWAREEKTLGEIRKILLGQEVVIMGTKGSGLEQFQGGEEVFLHWYRPGQISENVPYRLKGQKGKVVSIEVLDKSLNPSKRDRPTDVFGNTVKDGDGVRDPYIEIVVALDEGTKVATRGSYTTMIGSDWQFASVVEKERDEISKNINSLIGKVIYPVAYSMVYPTDIDMKELTDELRSDQYRIQIANLTPLTITKAKYLDGENQILLKVEFSNGSSGIIIHKIRSDPQDASFFERARGGFLTKIPTSLTKKEIDAIRKGSIFRGMSTKALYYSWGFPKEENDWGRGGSQLLYGNKQIVYTDNNKVKDWQSLSR